METQESEILWVNGTTRQTWGPSSQLHDKLGRLHRIGTLFDGIAELFPEVFGAEDVIWYHHMRVSVPGLKIRFCSIGWRRRTLSCLSLQKPKCNKYRAIA